MKINNTTYTVGADPELFVSSKGSFISAHNLIPGNKYKPHPVDKGAVQVDGMALEFNIDPADSKDQFISNIETVKSILKGMVGDEVDFMDVASVKFDKEFTKDVPRFNLNLGCSSDVNAWTMEENPRPKASNLMRTAGGHVHVGGFGQEDYYDWDYQKECGRLARILDETLGVYSLFWDKDDERRSMYGKAGSFRSKPYGMEYRTLSNAWIFDESLQSFVYDSVEEALVKFDDESYEPDPIVQDLINNSDRESTYFTNNLDTDKMERLVA